MVQAMFSFLRSHALPCLSHVTKLEFDQILFEISDLVLELIGFNAWLFWAEGDFRPQSKSAA